MKKLFLLVGLAVLGLVLTGCPQPVDPPIPTYTVTFNANGGAGEMASQTFTEGVPQKLMESTFTREGYIFLGWNTQADGMGPWYSLELEYRLGENLTLYARWEKLYTVTFDSNGGEGEMASQTFKRNTAQNLTPNNFTREGYTFTGWSILTDSPTLDYNDGQSYYISEDITLYAQWESNIYTVTFDSNNEGNGRYTQIFTYGIEQPLMINTFTASSGKNFFGWNTHADGTGTAYTDKQNFSIEENITLYAQWTDNIYTITFEANGGEGSSYTQTFAHGIAQNLTENAFTREGYTFIGWSTYANNYGADYIDKQSYTATESTTLFALWAQIHTVTFDANGGEGNNHSQTFTYGISQNLTANTFTREGYTFIGWQSYTEDGYSRNYADKVSYTAWEDTTLYAQWKLNTYTVTFEANGGKGNKYTQTFTYGTPQKLTVNAFYPPNGKVFAQWNTQKDGRGAVYTDIVSYYVTENITLYAQWEFPTYTVTFDANGGKGSNYIQTFTHGTPEKLMENIFTPPNEKLFKEWNTQKDGLGTAYTEEENFTATENTTLYAIWVDTPTSAAYFTISPDGVLTGFHGKSLAKIIIPSSIDGIPVTSIGDGVFKDCNNATIITIPAGITSIGDNAFENCSSVENIIIPDSVTAVGYDAFSGCTSLISITSPMFAGFKLDSMFDHNTQRSLKSIVITSGTFIAESAFFGCSNLTSITIPDSIMSIEKSAFSGCSSLTSINIPDSVTSIGDYAFSTCYNLSSITIPENVTSIGAAAFLTCKALTNITIPDSVTSIGDSAFSENKKLESITIGENVRSIGRFAFSSCDALTSIVIEALSPPEIYGTTFSEITTNYSIYVPSNSVDTYKKESWWSSLSSRIKAIGS